MESFLLAKKFKETILVIFDFVKEIVRKPLFYIPLLIFVTISYGFNLTNNVINIDDFAQELYYGSGNIKLKGLRWGQWILNRVFSTIIKTPFINKIIGLLFLIISAITICVIFKRITNEKRIVPYMIFASTFISFPLINEYWEYYESLTIPVNFSIVSFCILFQLINRKSSLSDFLVVGFLMSFVMSGYESLIFVYILLVFIIIYNDYVLNNKEGNWLKEGLNYAIPLFVALIIRYIIGYSILLLSNLSYEMDGAENLLWFTENIIDCCKSLLLNGWYYGVRGLSYLPIGEFVVASVVFVINSIKNQQQNKKSIIIGFFLYISTFGLGILQATKMPYRAAQTVNLFVAYIVFLYLRNIKKKNLYILFSTFFIFVCLRQSIDLNRLLSLNLQRSNNETNVVYSIGKDLYSNYDLEKVVIFCGHYDIGEQIESQIIVNNNSFAYSIENKIASLIGKDERPQYSEYVQSNINSVLNWGLDSFDGQLMIQKYFEYCGFNIKVINNWGDLSSNDEKKLLKKYTKIAESNDMKPLSIKEFDAYIIVYLGPDLSIED